ncbi:hypothetical protein D3C86_2264060 [compost metagenome]
MIEPIVLVVGIGDGAEVGNKGATLCDAHETGVLVVSAGRDQAIGKSDDCLVVGVVVAGERGPVQCVLR